MLFEAWVKPSQAILFNLIFMILNDMWIKANYKYEAFYVNCPSAARERQIVLYLAHVYDTKTYLKKFYDKHFRRIFSSTFQWYRQFYRNFPFSPSKSTKRVYFKKCIFNIFFYSLDRKLSIFQKGFLREIECERVDASPFRRAGLRDTARGLPSLRCLIIIFYNL